MIKSFLRGHNCLSPLGLPSHCSPDLYNGIWLLATQQQFNFPLTEINCGFEEKKIPVISKVETQLFLIDWKCQHCFEKDVKRKTIKQTNIFGGGFPLLLLPLHIRGKILKIPLMSLAQKSVILCLCCLTRNLLNGAKT